MLLETSRQRATSTTAAGAACCAGAGPPTRASASTARPAHPGARDPETCRFIASSVSGPRTPPPTPSPKRRGGERHDSAPPPRSGEGVGGWGKDDNPLPFDERGPPADG